MIKFFMGERSGYIRSQNFNRMKITQKIIFIAFLFPMITLWAQDKIGNTIRSDMPSRGICAHRGANETHPENTIAAFREAVRLGAQMVEFDVRMTKDDQLIIMHDRSVNRTTNGEGLVEELTWSEINDLDAGSWKSNKFKGEKVPSFKEALEVFPGNIWLNIHLKGDKELGYAVAKVLTDQGREHQGIIACGADCAQGVKKAGRDLMICNMERQENRKDYVKETIKGNFSTVQLLKKRNEGTLLNDINALKNNKVRINYFFSNEVEEGIQLFDMGVDFILTDKLEEMLKAAESIGIKRAL